MAMQRVVLHSSPAIALSGFVALPLLFVLSLHCWRCAGYAEVDRDAKGTIQRRFVSSVITCICSALLIYAIAVPTASGGLTYLELLGLQLPDVARACASCVGMTAVLFSGPIAQHLVSTIQGAAFCTIMSQPRWILARNLIMAPLTEEFVFRACLIRLWVGAGFSDLVIIFCSPMCFAMAHAHHFVELMRKSRVADTSYDIIREDDSLSREQVKKACLQVVFQMFYTCLFGIYASFLLLRTGSTIAVILAHSFCNHQGFPDVGFLFSKEHPLYQWRLCLSCIYLLGILAFSLLLGPLTAGFSSSFAVGATSIASSES